MDGKFITERYLIMNIDEVVPVLMNVYPNAIDLVPARLDNTTMVRTYLNKINGLLQRDNIKWLGRSPYLTPARSIFFYGVTS